MELEGWDSAWLGATRHEVNWKWIGVQDEGLYPLWPITLMYCTSTLENKFDDDFVLVLICVVIIHAGVGRFSAWGAGSPTFEGLGMDCAMVVPSLNFVWSDRPCAYSAGYICETGFYSISELLPTSIYQVISFPHNIRINHHFQKLLIRYARLRYPRMKKFWRLVIDVLSSPSPLIAGIWLNRYVLTEGRSSPD